MKADNEVDKIKLLIEDIIWVKQTLMIEVAAFNLLFHSEGRDAMCRVSEDLFGVPGNTMNGEQFIGSLMDVSRDDFQHYRVSIAAICFALLDLHEHIRLHLSDDQYADLEQYQWFRVLYHFRNGIGHDKRLRFRGKRAFRLLPVSYEPLHSKDNIVFAKESNGEIIELSEYDVHCVIDEALDYFRNC